MLREPCSEDKDYVLEFQREFNNIKEEFPMEGISNYRSIIVYDLWLKQQEEYKHIEDSRDDLVNQTTYIFVDENNYVYGACNIRHRLKGMLINHGGNVGYCIRPSKRNLGYGTKMLKAILDKCMELGLSRVLITARVENDASNKLIVRCGGVYENDYTDVDSNITYKRYWIDLGGEDEI